MNDTIWVFCGSGHSNFPSGVFSRREIAEAWIKQHSCSGTLTLYPVDQGAYDWAIERGTFRPDKPEHYAPAFIESFSDAAQEHYYYENGYEVSLDLGTRSSQNMEGDKAGDERP